MVDKTKDSSKVGWADQFDKLSPKAQDFVQVILSNNIEKYDYDVDTLVTLLRGVGLNDELEDVIDMVQYFLGGKHE